MINYPDRDGLIRSMKTLAGSGAFDLPSPDQPRQNLHDAQWEWKEGREEEIPFLLFVNEAYDSRKTGINTQDWLPSAYRHYICPDFLGFACSQFKSRKHEHFAIQIVFNFEAPFLISIDDSKKFELFFFIIPSYVPHRVISLAGKHLSILVDPLSVMGKKLHTLFNDPKLFTGFCRSVMDELYPNLQARLGEFESFHFFNYVITRLKHMVSGFPEYCMDERIWDAISRCRLKGGKGLGIMDLADWTCLSESRARHLFKEETGVPFTQYLKWLKLMEAIKYACTSRVSLTQAAHMTGFSDSAHLSRMFRETFGLVPSSVLQ